MNERMNPAVKAKWLEALRSGEYEQTTGTLHRVTSYRETLFSAAKPVGWCCYGVLCDVATKAGLSLSRKSDEDVEYFDGVVDYLPGSVVEWAGLSINDPEVQGRSLAHRNDNGAPFAEIADLIEEQL
jgi:hypothetical protein